MKNGTSGFVPKRKNGIAREVADDFIVYDEKTHKAHCLNGTAAQVWKLCDGKRNVAAIARAMEKDLKSPVDEELVWMTLRKLWKSQLLVKQEQTDALLARRSAIRKIGMAALALPVVTTILVPKAEAAVSCATFTQSCATKPCCSGQGLRCVGRRRICI
jgi:Coenzyme PQQ synthesis protein D (PqqD)